MAKRPVYQQLYETVQLLLKRTEALEKQVKELTKENKRLEERLAKYENPKNSGNSSMPPSKDENRPKPNQSLRESTGKKPGGQKGRKGKTLEMISDPDKVIELRPSYCRKCGLDLEGSLAQKEQSRQVVDIPLIKALFIEYQTFSKVCACGCQTVADFPEQVNNPISYGQNIEALIGYYHARQFLPFKRMQEMFNDIFNIKISEGGIHYLLNRFSDKVSPMYQIIKERIAESKVVGADETGVKVNGEKHWFWTWQSKNLTFIAHSENRKASTIEKHFPNGFPHSTLVHDGWKPQINTVAQNHQTCLAHLQRHLKYLKQLYKNNEWATQFLKLLYDSLDLKQKMYCQNSSFNIERHKIIQRLDGLLSQPPDKSDKKVYTFYKRMCKERQHLFIFLFIEQVPADNNASERAIRNVKVKQKISGHFKIAETANNFAKIRSVIDTAIKNGCNVLESLSLIAILETQYRTD